ncbi:MAG: DUF3180 domain-containing protein [Actinomycetales bacterium]|nr:DUF3180 domain-containing protein [Actinomycetales bacterium]
MTRTSPVLLLAFGVVGGALAVIAQGALAALSLPKLRPDYPVAISFLLIGVFAVVLAVPVWRTTRGHRTGSIDPFYATRVLMIAKSSAIVGALVTGAGAGLLGELLARAVPPGGDLLARMIVFLVAGVALLAGGLVAEHLCTVPPDDRDDEKPGGGPSGPVAA